MTISVVCQECDKQHSLKDELAGKKIRCNGCLSVIEVPSSSSDGDDPFAGLELKSSGKTLPKRRRRDDEDLV